MAANAINRLVGEFMGQYEEWEEAPESFDWDRLKALAQAGAQAYNEGFGPSFQILAFDGYVHAEFHERFLGYLLDAGFDPFMTVPAPNGHGYMPVFGHDGLAAAAVTNPASARMLARLQGLARDQLGKADAEERRRIIMLCPESIPVDVLKEFAPLAAAS